MHSRKEREKTKQQNIKLNKTAEYQIQQRNDYSRYIRSDKCWYLLDDNSNTLAHPLMEQTNKLKTFHFPYQILLRRRRMWPLRPGPQWQVMFIKTFDLSEITMNSDERRGQTTATAE